MNKIVDMAKRVKCEVYSRVVGYIRPVSNWNDGKKAEYEDRVEFVNDGKSRKMDVGPNRVKSVPGGKASVSKGSSSKPKG